MQEDIIQELLTGSDVLAVLPTGSGKSLCYQVPAMMSDGVCLVVSPLVALMEDQVKGLEKRGIRALHLGGGMNRNETITAFDNLLYGNFKLVYASPEKLQSDLVQEKLRQLPLSLIAIDEAHCISQWGHDFRPSYLKLSFLHELFPKVPRIALTATATERVEKDILVQLGLQNANTFRSSLYRKNLSIGLVRTQNNLGRLVQILKEKTEPAIVYVGTRKDSIVYARHLQNHGIPAGSYHGGLDSKERAEALEGWLSETAKVMVATNAFGMGIDKANVRCVIHCHVPMSIESYIQEIGRAGRDEKPAFAYLLFHEKSLLETNELIKTSLADPVFCKRVYTHLNNCFHIAQGEFRDSPLTFDLFDFCKTYELPMRQTLSALGHLERDDILLFEISPRRTSRIKIIEDSNALLQRSSERSLSGNILQVLLRNYGGIHEQMVSIQESFIASKAGVSRLEIIQQLEVLKKNNVLRYDKSDGLAELRFLVPREDNFVHRFTAKSIEARNKTKLTQLKSMQSYLENDRICRNRQLIAYFGEKDRQDCGQCDICRRKINTSNWMGYEKAADRIKKMIFSSGQLDFSEIRQGLKLDEDRLSKTLEMMVEKKWIRLNLHNKFELNE
jgi:ATP-dependent DNA helicase RecQ